MSFTDITAFLSRLQKAHAARQRKMLNLDVQEVSGVDHPAHLREGWVVRKAATAPHDHPADRHFLSQREAHTVEALHGAGDLKPGEFKKISETATLNREACGCLSLLTPETAAKAEGEAWAAERQRTGMQKNANTSYTPDEVRFLLGDDK